MKIDKLKVLLHHNTHGSSLSLYSMDLEFDKNDIETILDFLNYHSITELDLSRNKCIQFDGVKLLVKFLEDNKTLTSVYLSEINMTSYSMKKIINSLEKNKTITCFDTAYRGYYTKEDMKIQNQIDANKEYVTKTAVFLSEKIDFTKPLTDVGELLVEKMIYLKNYQILDQKLLKEQLLTNRCKI